MKMINMNLIFGNSNIFFRFLIMGGFLIFIGGCEIPDLLPDPTLEVTVDSDQTVDFGLEVILNGFSSHSAGTSTAVAWEIISKPGDSELTLDAPNANSITFLPDELGEYVFRFTATSIDGLTAFDEVVVTVIKAPVRLSGTITSDRVLENIYDDPNDPDYLVESFVNLAADVTIEEGVLIIFAENAGMEISSEGSLKAVGSENNPIVFTGVQETEGFWRGLNFRSRNPNNELHFVTVSYGGSGGFDGANRKANVTLNDAIVKISNSGLTHSEGAGLLTRNEEDQLPDFSNNFLSANALPAEMNKSQFHMLDATSDFSGNVEDYILSWGQNSLTEDRTWNALNVPIKLRPDIEIIESDLIIEKGSEFIGQNKSGLLIADNGSLSAIGTESENILFRGEEDVRGYWMGLQFDSNTEKNEMEFVIIKNGGERGFDGQNLKSNLVVSQNGKLKFKNCRLEKSADIGLIVRYVEGSVSNFENNTITNNKIPIQCKMNHFHYFDNASDLTGNDEDVIITTWADHPTEVDVTWKKTTVPYKITKADFIQSTISIEPGAEFIFTDDSGIEVWDQGAIIAEGTPDEPIIFRGDEDVQGYWRGLIVFSKSASNIMSNVVVSNGGSKPFNGAESNVVVWREARMQIFDSMFTMSGGFGIGVGKEGILSENGNTFENNVKGDIYYE